MKKTVLTIAISIAVASSSISSIADDVDSELLIKEQTGNINNLKEGTVFGTAAIVGGLLAGPIGAIVGGIGGTIMGPELTKADQYEFTVKENQDLESQLTANQQKVSGLLQQLQLARQAQEQLQQMAISSLEFQVLFHTGNDSLDGNTVKRIDELSNFLERNPELSVRLHGYADPRGTDEYNNVLSMHRALSVQKALEERGIDATRIERRSYGSDQSQATKGDLDAYALERRVSIEVFNRNAGVAYHGGEISR